MRRARELLERRERIKDIAALLCYGHQGNFTTAFTKFHGYPPRLHRKKIENRGLKMADDESRATKVETRVCPRHASRPAIAGIIMAADGHPPETS